MAVLDDQTLPLICNVHVSRTMLFCIPQTSYTLFSPRLQEVREFIVKTEADKTPGEILKAALMPSDSQVPSCSRDR